MLDYPCGVSCNDYIIRNVACNLEWQKNKPDVSMRGKKDQLSIIQSKPLKIHTTAPPATVTPFPIVQGPTTIAPPPIQTWYKLSGDTLTIKNDRPGTHVLSNLE